MKISARFFLIVLFTSITSYRSIATNNDITDFYNRHQSGRYLEAFQLAKQTKISEKIDTASCEYIKWLGCLGDCEAELELYEQSNLHLLKGLELCKTISICDSSLLVDILFNLAKVASFQEQDSLSVDYAERGWSLASKLFPSQSERYCEYYIEYLSDVIVDKIDNEKLAHAKKNGNSIIQARILKLEADETDSISKAIQLLEKACRIYGDSECLIDYTEYALMLMSLEQKYTQIGKYELAYNCCSCAYLIYKKTHGYYSMNCLTALLDMATIKGYMGEYEVDKAYLSMAKDIACYKYGDNSMEVAWVLSNEAVADLWSFKPEDALRHEESAHRIYERNLDKSDERYLRSLLNLSTLYCSNNRYEDGQMVINTYLDIVESCYGKENSEYASGMLYLAQADSSRAIALAQDAISIFDRLDDDECWQDKAEVYSFLADLYVNKDNCMASDYIAKALDIYQNRLSVHHTKYISALGLQSEIKYKLDDFESSINGYSNYLKYRKQDISGRFIGFDKHSRAAYWNGYLYPFHQMIPIETYFLREQASARTLLYNTILFKKGILLNAEQKIDRNEESINFSVLDNNYLNLDSIVVLSKKLSLPPQKHTTHLQNKYSEFQSIINIDYKDVRNALSKDEVAIEFTTIPLATDSILYCALMAKSDFDSPVLIPLFYEPELKMVSGDSLLSSNILYRLIWHPLKDQIDNVRSIYFSAEGELYNLPIENAFINNGTYISDIYDIHRLSSTREIIHLKQSHSPILKAILFGGLNYDANASQIEESNNQNHVLTDNITTKQRAMLEDCFAIEYLPFAGEEVLSIKQIFPITSDCRVFGGDQGTEELFKTFSGKELNIIHFSTHGYYWPKSKAQGLSKKTNLFNALVCEEDSTMTRSGLFLSGANNSLRLNYWPHELEDGIITAHEISQMSFINLDLVVLSACQTGLGDLKGDGIYGLQRGFKLAGAESLLMSLWKVNDFATKILMVEFYRNYLTGVGKQFSLYKAQKYVREYTDDRGNKLFEAPYYWAGFILLDALD